MSSSSSKMMSKKREPEKFSSKLKQNEVNRSDEVKNAKCEKSLKNKYNIKF